MASSNSLRRDPVQGRSSARVERILDECAVALDELGYDGITTSLLAERAGMSVGGLYRFFESKQAVVAELRRRRLGEILTQADEAVRAWDGDWRVLAATLIDLVAHMRRTVPGAGVLQLSSISAGLPRDPMEDERSATAIAAVLADRLGCEADEDFTRTVLIAYVTGDALCAQAFRSAQRGDEVILDAARSMVGDFLTANLGHLTPSRMAAT